MSHQDVQNQPLSRWLGEVIYGNLLKAIPVSRRCAVDAWCH
jgi:hypothetical protein